jgi:hypothetical protein
MITKEKVIVEQQKQYKAARDEERKRKFRSGRRDNQIS